MADADVVAIVAMCVLSLSLLVMYRLWKRR